MAREFGFRRGALNLVNWVSDQYSQYGTKVVSVAEREAIHTLEAILHTQLPIVEHTTDTHGATEIVFALFDLLGLRFIPRLRDAGDLLLHLLGLPTGLPVDAVMRSRARPQRILEHYDDLLRTAASLKRGWVPASLPIARLKNATPHRRSPPRSASTGGSCAPTSARLRRPRRTRPDRRPAQQGRDAARPTASPRHRLTRPKSPADEDDHRPHALCLQILVNAVQVCNVRYMTASIDHLHATNARRRRRRDRYRARRTSHARARQLARPLRPAPPAAARRTLAPTRT
jgi:TnpA family transposase